MRPVIFILALLICLHPALHGQTTSWYELTNRVVTLYQEGRFSEAIDIGEQALEQCESEYGTSHMNYVTSLNNLALMYNMAGSYMEAVLLYQQALETMEAAERTSFTVYGTILNNLAHLYGQLGMLEESAEKATAAIEHAENRHGSGHPTYANRLNTLALTYQYMGRYEDALPLYLEALAIFRNDPEASGTYFGTTLSNLGLLHQKMGNLREAAPYFREALRHTESIVGKDHPDYGLQLNNLGLLYHEQGRYGEALDYFHRTLENFEHSLGKEHMQYGIVLENLATLHLQNGQYDKSEELYLQCLEILENSLGREHAYYANALGNLAQLFRQTGRLTEAIPLLIEALDITGRSMGKSHPNYGFLQRDIAMIYEMTGHYEASLDWFLDALDNLERSVGTSHYWYGNTMNNLAFLLDKMGRTAYAEAFYLEAVDNAKVNLGTHHQQYGLQLTNLAFHYISRDSHALALPLLEEACANFKGQVARQFLFMTEREKLNFMRSISMNFEAYRSYCHRIHTEFPLVTGWVYDNEMLLKGLVLSSSSALQRTISQLADENIRDTYNEWRKIRTILTRQYALPIAERSPSVDSLEEIANSLEAELVRHIAGSEGSINQSDLSWQQVRDALQPGEAAVEFLNFRLFEGTWTDTVYYAALLIRPGMEVPVWIDLFTESQLDQLQERADRYKDRSMKIDYFYSKGIDGLDSEQKSYTKTGLHELVWKPLESRLRNVTTVYFSPSGKLNNLAFSALEDNEGNMLIDRYDLVQLGSSRQLVDREHMNDRLRPNLATVYGGIRYDLSDTELLARAAYADADQADARSAEIPADVSRGFSWQYLPGAAMESAYISELLEDRGVQVHFLEDAAADEATVKAMDGFSPDILHISTHGFFFPDPVPESGEPDLHDLYSGEEMARFSEDPLLRSGLVFAGANHVWKGGKRLEGAEDGILTAYEISNMDLSNTDLVVLSACETGLGDIQGSEGVFGLQRAFKMAGVDNIIMSLWQVPDEETADFMMRFYDLLLDGETIGTAFRSTQREMAEKYVGEPYKWAAFVLME